MYKINIPLHPFNAIERPNTLAWEKTSPFPFSYNGFGHAFGNTVDEFATHSHGTMTISSDGGLYINSKNKYILNTNTMFNNSYHFETSNKPNWKYGGVVIDKMTYLPVER